jgi:hypothetical protein
LLSQNLASERHVEPPEVDQFAGCVDLGLKHCLGLTKHRCGVDPIPPWASQQVSGPKQHGSTVVVRERSPSRCRCFGSSDGSLAITTRGIAQSTQDVVPVVWLDDGHLVTTTHAALAPDHLRQLALAGSEVS